MIDPSNVAAMVAEAERRQKLRDAGRALSGGAVVHGGPFVSSGSVRIEDAVPVLAIAAPDDLFRDMNGIERRRAIELETLKRAGEIQRWEFEAVTLKLAEDLRYTPDFLVIESNGLLRFEETKGHWRDDARAKIRLAASRFSFASFVALRARKKKDGGGWAREAF